MTGSQVDEARKLPGWSADGLGARCGMTGKTILRLEKSGTVPLCRCVSPYLMSADRPAAVRTALEAFGVEFTNEDAPGVKLRKAEE